eukprot:TRINITY_DN2950_c0_g2_i1.p1 TRINITY_DN2950_c0_g2~~TRINITY_DN2950_c0_g2_i1.p1  ORF type:complete len:1239 (-),score=490.38 TRINITY_DN2950_c0_g2_i1:60-3776(-)
MSYTTDEEMKRFHTRVEEAYSLLDDLADDSNMHEVATVKSITGLIDELAQARSLNIERLREAQIELNEKDQIIFELKERIEQLENNQNTSIENPLAGQLQFEETLEKLQHRLQDSKALSKSLIQKNVRLKLIIEDKVQVNLDLLDQIEKLENELNEKKQNVEEMIVEESPFFNLRSVTVNSTHAQIEKLKHEMDELKNANLILRQQLVSARTKTQLLQKSINKAFGQEDVDSKFSDEALNEMVQIAKKKTGDKELITNSLSLVDENELNSVKTLKDAKDLIILLNNRYTKSAENGMQLQNHVEEERNRMKVLERDLREINSSYDELTKKVEDSVALLYEKANLNFELSQTPLESFEQCIEIVHGLIDSQRGQIEVNHAEIKQLKEELIQKKIELLELRQNSELEIQKIQTSEFNRCDDLRKKLMDIVGEYQIKENEYLNKISELHSKLLKSDRIIEDNHYEISNLNEQLNNKDVLIKDLQNNEKILRNVVNEESQKMVREIQQHRVEINQELNESQRVLNQKQSQLAEMEQKTNITTERLLLLSNSLNTLRKLHAYSTTSVKPINTNKIVEEYESAVGELAANLALLEEPGMSIIDLEKVVLQTMNSPDPMGALLGQSVPGDLIAVVDNLKNKNRSIQLELRAKLELAEQQTNEINNLKRSLKLVNAVVQEQEVEVIDLEKRVQTLMKVFCYLLHEKNIVDGEQISVDSLTKQIVDILDEFIEKNKIDSSKAKPKEEDLKDIFSLKEFMINKTQEFDKQQQEFIQLKKYLKEIEKQLTLIKKEKETLLKQLKMRKSLVKVDELPKKVEETFENLEKQKDNVMSSVEEIVEEIIKEVIPKDDNVEDIKPVDTLPFELESIEFLTKENLKLYTPWFDKLNEILSISHSTVEETEKWQKLLISFLKQPFDENQDINEEIEYKKSVLEAVINEIGKLWREFPKIAGIPESSLNESPETIVLKTQVKSLTKLLKVSEQELQEIRIKLKNQQDEFDLQLHEELIEENDRLNAETKDLKEKLSLNEVKINRFEKLYEKYEETSIEERNLKFASIVEKINREIIHLRELQKFVINFNKSYELEANSQRIIEQIESIEFIDIPFNKKDLIIYESIQIFVRNLMDFLNLYKSLNMHLIIKKIIESKCRQNNFKMDKSLFDELIKLRELAVNRSISGAGKIAKDLKNHQTLLKNIVKKQNEDLIYLENAMLFESQTDKFPDVLNVLNILIEYFNKDFRTFNENINEYQQ